MKPENKVNFNFDSNLAMVFENVTHSKIRKPEKILLFPTKLENIIIFLEGFTAIKNVLLIFTDV